MTVQRSTPEVVADGIMLQMILRFVDGRIMMTYS